VFSAAARMKLRLAGTANPQGGLYALNIDHRTSNIERRILMDSQKVKTSIFVHCNTLKLHALKFCFCAFCGHINIDGAALYLF
jgi:hypothetical protein